jgi:hypothetical protein
MFILVRLLCRRGRASQKLAHALRNPFDAAMIGICAAFRIGNALVNERKYPNIVELTVPADGLEIQSNRRIIEFHKSRHIQPRHGREIVRGNRIYFRWCWRNDMSGAEEMAGANLKLT